MIDERFQNTVGSWLRDEDPAPPDPLQSARQVAARLPLVRQQGRWWPLPPLRRSSAPTPATTETTEYRASPIPASNGHTPTAIGRTSPMLSPAKAITAGAIVFALGGAFLIGQPLHQQGSAPGAESGAAEAPAWVTATVGFSGNCDFGDTATEGGVTQERGMYCLGQTWASDDPRLDGYASVAHNADSFEVDGQGYSLVTSAVEFSNDTGGWQCTNADRVVSPADTLYQTSRFGGDRLSCVGNGAYEGLSAILTADWDGPSTKTVEGLIFPGEMPPMPEFPAAE